MKRIIFLFLLCFSPIVWADPIKPDSLITRFLSNVQKMSLHFEQTKTIPEIERSFKSFGIFQFVRGKGIIIRQEKPNTQTFVSTTEKFCFEDKSDLLENLPHFSGAKSLVDHLLAGDVSDLEKIFEVSYKENSKTWQMDLTPHQDDLKNFIQKIVLKGNVRFIQKVVIEYVDGTKMNIDYSPIQQDLSNDISC